MAETVLYLVFCGMSCFFWPLYLILLLCIIYDRTKSERFATTFYNLLISLGIGDLLAMLSFLYMRLIRNQYPLEFWENQHAYWAAPFGYNHIYYCLFIRCFGAALISFQRYVAVCQSTTKLCQIMQHLSFWQIFLVHWIPPTLYSIPIISNTNISYDSPLNFNTILDPEDIKYATYSGDVFCLVTFIICVSCYFLVLRLFRTANMNRSLRKELRITIQVAGPVLAITTAFVYYLLQLIFATINKSDLIIAMRNINPLVTGFMSYVNPITYLVFSEDMRKLVWNTFSPQRYQVEHSTSRKRVVSKGSTAPIG